MKYYFLLLVLLIYSCHPKMSRVARRDMRAPTTVIKVPGVVEVLPEITGNPIPPYKNLESFSGDTTQYVKESILNRKEAYIQREMSVFLKDYELPIKFYLPGGSRAENSWATTNVSLLIFNDVDEERRLKAKQDPISLVVKLKNPIPTDLIQELGIKSQEKWTEEAKSLFSKQVITDILLTRYNSLK